MINANEYLDLLLKESSQNQLKTILDSDIAYEILDRSKATGGTWSAGGCAILAFALNKLFGYEIYVIYNLDKDNTEHFMVMNKESPSYFVDYYGKHQWDKEYTMDYKRDEMIEGDLVVKKWNSSIKSDGIPIDHSAISELVELFKSENLNEL